MKKMFLYIFDEENGNVERIECDEVRFGQYEIGWIRHGRGCTWNYVPFERVIRISEDTVIE